MNEPSYEWSDVPDDTPERLDDNEQARFGRYVLCRRLADGGMGTVYLAKAEGPKGFERAIAIKRIHPHLARRKDLVDMFLDEARLCARIHHPNVCATFDFGEADGTWFLAMEYLLGESLASVVREVALRAELLGSERWRAIVARIIADAAEGLHAAHELTDERGRPLGVVHRDVSPQNLFVTYDGAVKVLDFGVARAAGRVHETRAGALKGKVAYMAPEQATAGPVDRRADVFALGVCLWEALTGRRLFKRATDIETIGAVKDQDIPTPSSMRPGIEPELDRIAAGALTREPNLRIASARELATALEGYLHGRSSVTTRATVGELMTEMFESRRAEKSEIVRTELGAPPERSGVVPARASREGTASMAGPPNAPSSPPRVGEPTPSFVPVPAGTAAPRVEAPSTRPPRRILWVGSSLAALAGIAAIAVLMWPDGATQPQVVLPSEPASAPAIEVAPEPQPVPEPALQAVSDAVSDESPPAREARPISESARRVRRRDRTPVEAPANPPGRVNVVTPGGWADVYVGERYLGRTPRSVQLPPGAHVLELRPFGRTPGRRVHVQVEAGGVERVVSQVTQ